MSATLSVASVTLSVASATLSVFQQQYLDFFSVVRKMAENPVGFLPHPIIGLLIFVLSLSTC
jgi:hypothetical protein